MHVVRWRWMFVMLAVLAVLPGCASSKRSKRAAVPLENVEGLSVVLIWTVPVDLDLYLTDPNGETAYFGNRWTRSGTKLRDDVGCNNASSAAPPYRETAGTTRPMPGRYRVSIAYQDSCNRQPVDAVPFRLWARMGGSFEELKGAARARQLNQNVFEFDVSSDRVALERREPSGRPATILPAPREVQASAR